MAKAKKAPPKKALNKKTKAKKASPKKVAAKKPSAKVAQKTKITKPTKTVKSKKASKLPAKTKTKTKAKATSSEASLEKHFIESLYNLESFWSKKVNTLKKECDALVNKHKKETQGKMSPKQAEKLNALEKAIADKQDALDEASLGAAKFAALSKKIAEFEKEWLQELNAHAANTSQPVAAKVQEPSEQKPVLNKGFKKLTDDLQSMSNEWEDEQEDEEALADDLEDIFMPQDELSEFEVIEDFSVTNEDDFEDEE